MAVSIEAERVFWIKAFSEISPKSPTVHTKYDKFIGPRDDVYSGRDIRTFNGCYFSFMTG